MFKKIASIFLTGALLLSTMPVIGNAENTEIFKVGVEAVTAASTVSATPIIYNQGEEITVKIRASQNTGITSLKLRIDYDESILEPVEDKCAAAGLFDENDSLTSKVSSKTGDGYFIFYSDSYPSVNTSLGMIAELTFLVKQTCAESTMITVSPWSEGSCVVNTVAGVVPVTFALESPAIAVHKIDATAGVVTLPTCTEDGYTTYICSDCGKTVVGNIVPENGHTPGDGITENLVNPICTADGSYDTVIYCSVAGCGVELSRMHHVITMLDHNAADAVVENRVEPTCTVDGSYDSVVYCKREGCGAELSRETITIPMVGHDAGEAVIENRVEPSCTVDGSYDKVTYCKTEGCGAELSRETIIIPMVGHDAGEAVIENRVEPSCTVDGSYDKVTYCKTEGCGAELSREMVTIPMIPHELVHHDAQEATHTQIGWAEYDTCKNCEYTTYEEIPMVPYAPGDLDKDDIVTDADAIYLLYATFDTANYPLNQNADYNGDGEVTDADAIYLLYATFNPIEYPLVRVEVEQ